MIDSDAFVLVYDARDHWPWDLDILLITVPALLLVLLFRVLRQHTDVRFRGHAIVGVLVGVCATMFTALWIGARLWQHQQLRDAIEHGRHATIEGRIVEFTSTDERIIERWVVENSHQMRRYELGRYALSPGYRGGAVYLGAYVRIADVDGYVGRLEIRR